MLKKLLFILLLILPVACWALLKPIRVLAPELAGVSCINDILCLDNTSRTLEAENLYANALQFVNSSVGVIKNKPRVIFCETESCFQAFGLGKRASATIATLAIVISPRAWEPHYVQHEMIHYLQKERLGNIRTFFSTPEWFIEGMAYSLSNDPRLKLSQPFEDYRSRFHQWFMTIEKEQLWSEAGKL